MSDRNELDPNRGEQSAGDTDAHRVEEERRERLDPDNRPENVEVDNTQRTFDPRTGTFEDSDVEPAGDFADEG